MIACSGRGLMTSSGQGWMTNSCRGLTTLSGRELRRQNGLMTNGWTWLARPDCHHGKLDYHHLHQKRELRQIRVGYHHGRKLCHQFRGSSQLGHPRCASGRERHLVEAILGARLLGCRLLRSVVGREHHPWTVDHERLPDTVGKDHQLPEDARRMDVSVRQGAQATISAQSKSLTR